MNASICFDINQLAKQALVLLICCVATSTVHGQQIDIPAKHTLKSKLDAMAEQSKARFPGEMLKTMEDAIQEVRDSDLVENAWKTGDLAIDATLKDYEGNSVTLSDQWKNGPVVLMWYRGGWCPYCNLQLQAMNQRVKNLESVGAKLIVISPELPDNAQATATKNELKFMTLHDPHNQLAKKYGLVFKISEALQPLYRDRLGLDKVNGDDSMELPLSATYVIDTQGKIRYSFLDEDYKKRAEPDDVMVSIRSIVGPPEVGQVADDFTLPSLNGDKVTLREKIAAGPVVLVMLRGYPGYQCPICSRQVAALVNNAKAIDDAGASVVLVYPGKLEKESELVGKAKEFVGETKLPDNFTLLIDSDYRMTHLYGLRWDADRETAYPSTFVIDSEGKIKFAKISKEHGGRSKTEEVITALKALASDRN